MPEPGADISSAMPAGASASHDRSSWASIFGFDVFLSFALGPPPRGCRAYASDLARRLRERGFTVFFSEDEAPAGNQLDATLKRGLKRSRLLVMVANKGTLEDPRWVKREVQEFYRCRPRASVVPINVDGALAEPSLAAISEPWLRSGGRIWVDETAEAVAQGQVSDAVLERLITAPHALRSLVRLRIAIGVVLTALALLAAVAMIQRSSAREERDRAQQALLSSAARQALLLSRDGRAHEGWAALVHALALANPTVDEPLPDNFLVAALTTLVENRRGPALSFNDKGEQPQAREDGDTSPPAHAFSATGDRVAVAAGFHVAIWSTQDGRRLSQAKLPFVIERLEFGAKGEVLVAQGVEQPQAADEQRQGAPRASAVDVASGRYAELPLRLCENVIPCIGDSAAATQLLPVSSMPTLDRVVGVGAVKGTAYLAYASGTTRLRSVSGGRYVLLQQEGGPADRSWQLLDRSHGTAVKLDLPIDADQVSLARDVPMLVTGSSSNPDIVVYRIEPGAQIPRLLLQWRIRAMKGAATKNVELDPSGMRLRYQNWRYGTGTGVGVGRTVLFDLGSGREQWARGEGEVAWGNALVALQEDWVDTQVMSAQTGATWFVAPGRPIGFDPTGRMLLMWEFDNEKTNTSPWPSVHLLETLPVRQFARDSRGPASQRSKCSDLRSLNFMTLSERADRMWNEDDWHVLKAAASSALRATTPVGSASAAVVERASGETQRVRFKRLEGQWYMTSGSGDTSVPFDLAEALRRFPLLSPELQSGRSFDAVISTSADKQWIGVVVGVDDEQRVAACKGWASWRMKRIGDSAPVRAGCTGGDLPGPGYLPEVHFLEAPAGSRVPLLAVVPSDTCKYEVMQMDTAQIKSVVTPAFGNNVSFKRLNESLIVVTATDWYESTTAIQLHALSSSSVGPVFIFAHRNDVEKEATTAKSLNTGTEASRPLFQLSETTETEPENVNVELVSGGRVLSIVKGKHETLIDVPPWGERLRERLSQAVKLQVNSSKQQSEK